jgi:hypothetical protein
VSAEPEHESSAYNLRRQPEACLTRCFDIIYKDNAADRLELTEQKASRRGIRTATEGFAATNCTLQQQPTHQHPPKRIIFSRIVLEYRIILLLLWNP